MADRIFLNAGRAGQIGEAPGAGFSTAARPRWLLGAVRAVRVGREDYPVSVTEQVLPDGAVHVLFDLGEHPAATVHGPTMTATPLHLAGTIDQVGIELAPGAVAAVLGVPAWSLRGRTWALSEILGRRAEQWLSMLWEAPPARRAVIISDLLTARLSEAPTPDARATAAADVLTRPRGPAQRRLAVPELADRVGLSARQLEQVFRDTVGLSPRELIRLSRFHRLCGLIATHRTYGLAVAAQEAGYADQAHASREAKRISGLPLSQLRDRGIVQDSPGVSAAG